MQLWSIIRVLGDLLFAWEPRFSRYRPAPRLGTRRVEQRLLYRLNGSTVSRSSRA